VETAWRISSFLTNLTHPFWMTVVATYLVPLGCVLAVLAVLGDQRGMAPAPPSIMSEPAARGRLRWLAPPAGSGIKVVGAVTCWTAIIGASGTGDAWPGCEQARPG
jgi:hypothetical protein